MQRLLIFISLLLLPCFTLAMAEKNYQIELIVFSHITPENLASEQWSTVSQIPHILQNQENLLIHTSGHAFILKKEAAILANRPDYQVLYYGTWRSSASNLQSPKILPIQTDQLTGLIRIVLTHYFDLQFHLLLKEPTNFLQQIKHNHYFDHWHQPTFTFALQQDRRMRSNELNYVGHPIFGALIKIEPIQSIARSQEYTSQ